MKTHPVLKYELRHEDVWGSGGAAPRINLSNSGHLHAPAALTPKKEPPLTHWIGG